jgi:predicted unusual protein kinase regulating ubiquinone biosynthesis (AarF/ABC1/UbiB family)/nucleotide-binding universal stress UspA family protein
MSKRILAVTEHASATDEVARWGADWARHEGAELILLRVEPAQEPDGSEPPVHQAEPDAELTDAAHHLVGDRGRGIRLSAADAAEAIVHFAADQRCDLIVCGNEGMHGRKDFLLHNVPNRITHLAHCSVMLVNTSPVADDVLHSRFHHHRPAPNARPDPASFEGHMLGRAAEIGRMLTLLGAREAVTARRHRGDLRREAKLLRESLEKLGPTFEKLGQMLSTRPDLLAQEFIDELATLQDDVPPLSHAEVVRVMEQELHVPWEDVFESVARDPIAAGTIAQVHRAVLAGGEHVVIKVQRPRAEEEMSKDLALMRLFAERAAGRESFDRVIDLPAIIEHLSDSLQRELDFVQEAENIERMEAVLVPYARLRVPAAHKEYSTHRLLVMEEIHGAPLLEAPHGPERSEAARQLVESYYEQVLVAGFFHADPHPGNLLWCDGQIVFLDFGMVGEVDAHTRDLLGFLLLSFWHEDIAFLGETLVMLAERRGHVDHDALRADLSELVGRYRHTMLDQLQLGPMLQDLTQLCIRNELRMPASLALIGKALGQMQLAAARLDPDIDPFSVAGRFFTRQVTRNVRDMFGPQRMLYNAQKIRMRAVSLMDSIERLTGAKPGFEPAITLRGTERLESTLRHVGRRLAAGMTAASAFIICGVTAAFGHAATWLTVAFGAAGGVFALLLLADLVRRA